MGRIRGITAAALAAAMLFTVLVPVSESEASEPTVVFSTDFEGLGIFISDWEPLGWSRGDYAAGHGDDQWCRANAQWMRTLSDAVGYEITAHSSVSTLYGAKLGTNSENHVSNIANGYPDPGMDSWVRYSPPDAERYDGMTLTFWYWARTQSSDFEGPLTDYLCVNINNGTTTTRAWIQPTPDSQGWRMATVDLPTGTVWMEWEFKTGPAPESDHYPGVLIDDMTLVAGKVLPGPPTSHVGGMNAYYNSRSIQVPVGISDADRISLYYRLTAGTWTKYVDAAHPDGLFDTNPVTFKAPGDGVFELFSIASNETYTEPMKAGAEATFTIDTVAPTVSVTAPAHNSIFGSGAVTLTWIAGDAGTGLARNAVSLDEGALTDVSGTSFTIGPLGDGSHTATVWAFDRAGNSMKASVTFTVDGGAPTMTVSPTGIGVDRGSTITVSFLDDVDATSVSIAVDGVAGSLSWSGDTATFMPSSPLAAGTTYVVTVMGVDAEGDSFSERWSFTTIEDRGSISGTIRDGSGNPVVKAKVTLSDGQTTLTDEAGYFEFENVIPGTYTITVKRDGYEDMTADVEVTPSQVQEIGTMNLKANTVKSAMSYATIATVIFSILVVLYCVAFVVRRKR